MTKPGNRIPSDQLLPACVEFIKTASRTSAELAKLTGYAQITVRLRLNVLEERGAIHKTPELCATGMGMTYRWHHGKGPAKRPIIKPPAKPILGEVPRRFFPKTYPAIGRRDPLVTALFGPAGARP